jgi:hypothetical protein
MAELGERARLPLLNIEEGDVGVLLAGPLIGLVFGSTLGGGTLLTITIATGLFAGVVIVYAAPSHLTAWAWLSDVVRFALFQPRLIRSHATPETKAATGAPLGWTPFVPDETTIELTGIDRLWTPEEPAARGHGFGAVQRRDGVMQAFVEVRPSNMDFAMSGDWATSHAIAEHFVNTEVDFPLTFHATTRTFPVERMLERIETRLQDADVQASPALQSLLEEYREQRPRELDGRQELHYYLGVAVDHLDVYTQYEQEPTPSEKLARIPLLGMLFTPFLTRRERYEQDEIREAMFTKLEERLQIVEREFIEKVPGWSSIRLDGGELLTLIASFWNGTAPTFEALPEAAVLGANVDTEAHR